MARYPNNNRRLGRNYMVFTYYLKRAEGIQNRLRKYT